MAKRFSILLTIVIAGMVACGKEGTGDSENNPGRLKGPPSTNHSITVTTTTDPGTSSNPSIVTYVCQPCKDTIAWNSVGGNLAFTWVTTPNPYSHEACPNSSTCTSGSFGGTWTSNQQFDYTLMVGSYGPIYGRIIIKP